MQKTYVVLTGIAALLVSIAGLNSLGVPAAVFGGEEETIMAQQGPQKIELRVKKVDGVWKVVDSQEKTNIRAKRSAEIVWSAEGTDVYFQFVDGKLMARGRDRVKARNAGQAANLPDVFTTQRVRAGESLSLIVRASAVRGRHKYAVFCMADSVFATGNSPPEIIIE